MLSRSRMVLVCLAAAWPLSGCGGGPTISFTRHPHTLHLRVGDQVGVRASLGECASPWSTKPAVIVAENPPRLGDCSQETVEFRAIGAGQAEIHGALPCRVPDCAAMGAAIPVIVTEK